MTTKTTKLDAAIAAHKTADNVWQRALTLKGKAMRAARTLAEGAKLSESLEDAMLDIVRPHHGSKAYGFGHALLVEAASEIINAEEAAAYDVLTAAITVLERAERDAERAANRRAARRAA